MADYKLTNGKMSIGAYRFPDRKRPALCIQKGNKITIFGYFQSTYGAECFMKELGQFIGAEFKDAENQSLFDAVSNIDWGAKE